MPKARAASAILLSEASEQILAKRARPHRMFQVFVGRRNDADVDRDGDRATDPRDFPLLQHAQQLGLQSGLHVADLVEEDRPLCGAFEGPDFLPRRPGKSPPLMAEQFAFDERFGNRGTRKDCR